MADEGVGSSARSGEAASPRSGVRSSAVAGLASGSRIKDETCEEDDTTVDRGWAICSGARK